MQEINKITQNQSPVVSIGTKVSIEVNGEPQVWEIVNINESDIPKGKLSCNAPLAQCIWGAKNDDRITGRIIDKNVEIVIKSISFVEQRR